MRPVGLKRCVEVYLGLVIAAPEGIEKKAQYRQRECAAEMRGFNKAQETLRDLIRANGTAVSQPLADVRSDGQQRPKQIGDMQVWVG